MVEVTKFIPVIVIAFTTLFFSQTAIASGIGLTQTASTSTDFPSNNAKAIQVHVASAKKDSIGYYHVVGEITNIGSTTISGVQVTAHFSDSNGQVIGDATGYTTPTNLDAGHTGTFDALVSSDQINGSPSSFKLSYDWS